MDERLPDARPLKPRYHRPVAEATQTVNEQLDEIGAQLDWVRDYL
jgi:hypothetical protein